MSNSHQLTSLAEVANRMLQELKSAQTHVEVSDIEQSSVSVRWKGMQRSFGIRLE